MSYDQDLPENSRVFVLALSGSELVYSTETDSIYSRIAVSQPQSETDPR